MIIQNELDAGNDADAAALRSHPRCRPRRYLSWYSTLDVSSQVPPLSASWLRSRRCDAPGNVILIVMPNSRSLSEVRRALPPASKRRSELVADGLPSLWSKTQPLRNSGGPQVDSPIGARSSSPLHILLTATSPRLVRTEV